MPPELDRCVASFIQDEANVKRWPDPDVRKSHAFAICTAALKKGGAMDEPHFGYISLADTFQFDTDKPTSSWIQAFPLGRWNHPVYGEIEITPERVARFAENINNNVVKTQLDIDYRHKADPAKGGQAAGWVARAEDRGDQGLWINIEWTEDAANEVKQNKWKYFSPEFADEWEDTATGAKHHDVMLGGALTNRPFLREIQPINLEEVVKVQDYLNDYLHALEEDGVKVEDILDEASLKYLHVKKPKDPPTPILFEDEIKAGLYLEGIELRDIPQSEREKHSAADFAGKDRSFPIFACEDVAAAASSLGRAGPANYGTDQLKSNIIRIANRKGFSSCLPNTWKSKKTEEVNMELVKQLQETLGLANADEDTLVARVGELNGYFEAKSSEEERAKRFEEDYPEEFKRLNSMEKTRKLEVTKARISQWAGQGLPAVVHDRIKELRTKLSDDDAKLFDEVINGITKVGLVKLAENGASHGLDTELEGSVEAEIKRLMEEDDSLTRKQAMTKVFEDHKEWAREYAMKGGEA